MKCYAIVIFVFMLPIVASARQLSAYEKALLDQYYARLETNVIDGIFLISNSVPPDRIINTSLTQQTEFDGVVTGLYDNLAFSVPVVTNEIDPVFTNWLDTNAYVKVEIDPVFTNWQATNQIWYYTTNVPASSTSTASPRTLTASGTNFYVCISNNWAGTGTNWLTVGLKPF